MKIAFKNGLMSKENCKKVNLIVVAQSPNCPVQTQWKRTDTENQLSLVTNMPTRGAKCNSWSMILQQNTPAERRNDSQKVTASDGQSARRVCWEVINRFSLAELQVSVDRFDHQLFFPCFLRLTELWVFLNSYTERGVLFQYIMDPYLINLLNTERWLKDFSITKQRMF